MSSTIEAPNSPPMYHAPSRAIAGDATRAAVVASAIAKFRILYPLIPAAPDGPAPNGVQRLRGLLMERGSRSKPKPLSCLCCIAATVAPPPAASVQPGESRAPGAIATVRIESEREPSPLGLHRQVSDVDRNRLAQVDAGFGTARFRQLAAEQP